MNGPNPNQQTNWDWRAASNFIFGGAGSGLVVCLVFAALGVSYPWLYLLVSLALVGTGLALVWTELGRPFRFANVLRHPKTSWMSREAYAAIFLMAFGLLSLLSGHPLAYFAAGISGFAFLYCQTRMLNACMGIPAWRVQTSVLLFVSTGLAEGASLLLIIGYLIRSVDQGATIGPIAYVLVLAFVALRWVAWVSYRNSLLASAPTLVIDGLNRFNGMVQVLGHIVPLILIIAAITVPGISALQPVMFVLAALIALSTGWFIKFFVVLLIGSNQGYAIPVTPERGPAGIVFCDKPGWTQK
ncbi:MAG: dimethyl sulfoxide reductase anchor subunit [Rhodobacteraceae bacterium]|nr:dimethyl sulfoxide reductase anchor subunit [Paracoccaceae bacterium]